MYRFAFLILILLLQSRFVLANSSEFQGFLNIIDTLQAARGDDELIRLSRPMLMYETGLPFTLIKAGKNSVFESDAVVEGTNQVRYRLYNHRVARISYLYFYFTSNIEPLKKALLKLNLQYQSRSRDVEDRTIWHYQGDRIYVSIYDCPLRDKDPKCMKSVKVNVPFIIRNIDDYNKSLEAYE